MNDDISTNTIDDGPIYLNEISCSPYSKAEWFSDRCDQLQRMLAEMADRCRQNDVELDRLRKIAGRFRPGDIELLQTAEKWIPFSPREEDYRGWSVEHMKEIQDCLRRAQAAAKLAQDGA